MDGGVLVEFIHGFMYRVETCRAVEWHQHGTVGADCDRCAVIFYCTQRIVAMSEPAFWGSTVCE